MVTLMKRLLVCMLAAALLVSAVPASTAAFSDITDSALAQQVDLLEALGIFAGMPDGTFHPNDMLNRASFCVLAVKLTSPGTDPSNYTGYAYFPDVRATHWGLGWVNASRSLGLISGYPNGSFGPADPITFGQAVTVLMRALDYTDEQVGFNWPLSYINKAASIGMTKGLTRSPNDPVSRADAARMIYNLLYIPKYNTKDSFMSTLGVTEQKDVILLSVTATMGDGATPAIMTSAGTFAYKTAPASSSLGRKGTLLLDKDSRVMSFATGSQTSETAIVSEIKNIHIKSVAGKTFLIGEEIPVYSPEKSESAEYSKAFVSITPGETVSISFTSTGAIEYIYRHSAPGNSGVIAVLSDPLTSANPVIKAFGAKAGSAVIYKNGYKCDVSDLCRWDVMSYDAASNTVQVSDIKLTGAYQEGTPNNTTPTKIKTLGQTDFYSLTPEASSKMSSCKIGAQYTYLLAPNGYIADVLTTATLRSNTVALASQANVSGVSTIELPGTGASLASGISSTPDYSGQLVTFSHTSGGTIYLTPVQYLSATGSLDLSTRTLGDTKLSPYCKFYETAAKNGILTEITSTDVLPQNITRDKILYTLKDATGKITHVVFNGLIYDSYVFGPVEFRQATQSGQVGSVDIPVIAVGEGTSFQYKNEELPSEGAIVGLSGVRDGLHNTYLYKWVECKKYTGVNRYAFDGSKTVTVDSRKIPIAPGLQVHVKGTTDTLSIEEALAYTDSFEVYTDPGDYRIRYIIAV